MEALRAISLLYFIKYLLLLGTAAIRNIPVMGIHNNNESNN